MTEEEGERRVGDWRGREGGREEEENHRVGKRIKK